MPALSRQTQPPPAVRTPSPLRFRLTVFLLLSSVIATARAEENLEYRVKAACLLNFLKFVEWPAGEGPLVVGVLGTDPFHRVLDDTVAGKHVNGRAIVVRRFRDEDAPDGCHLLFLKPGRAERQAELFRNLAKKPVLTVGESADFLRGGGMIRFVIDNERVRFEIHQGAAERAGLKLSSRLLQLARNVVKDGEAAP